MAFRPKIKNANGTLTDLPLAAETAVKLKTSRSIGLSGVVATSQSFNGTSAITIPVTAVPASLLTGLTNISVGKATKLTESWTALTPGITVLPYGTYLFRVDLADGNSGIGNYGTIFTDVISLYAGFNNTYVYRGIELPSGGIHVYVANGYEASWFKTARIKVSQYDSNGFSVDVYLSETGGYLTTTMLGK